MKPITYDPSRPIPSGPARVPEHVAIVMDGNGRWAQQRGLPRPVGHLRGSEVATAVYRACRAMGVRHLTLYGFSLANWRRPQTEIDALMALFADYAARLCDDFIAKGIELRIIGEIGSLPEHTRRSLQATAKATEAATRPQGPAMTLSLAIAYGGRSDVIEAARRLVARAQAGELTAEEVDLSTLRGAMSTADLPDPDLLIRTGGEIRLSDFLTFESAFTELVFCDVLWPDFGEDALKDAFAQFAGRERRYGAVGSAPAVMTTATAAKAAASPAVGGA